MTKARKGALPRGDKRVRTRQRILESASALVRERGFAEVVVADVAQRAGVTRRTVYDHFVSKEALFIALASRSRATMFPAPRPGVPLRIWLRSVARAIVDAPQANPGGGLAAASFELQALSNEELREQVLAKNRELYRLIEKNLIACYGRDGLGMPPARFVRVLHGLVDGMLARRHLMPEEFTDKVVLAAFDALAASAP